MRRILFQIAALTLVASIAAPHPCAAQAGSPAAAPATAAQTIPPRTITPQIITDPALNNMKAFTVNIPAGWKFQGAVLAPIHCNPVAPVFRAYSPDGLSDIALLPTFSWSVPDPAHAAPPSPDPSCFRLSSELTAEKFVNSFLATLDAPRTIGPMPVAPLYQQQFEALLKSLNEQKTSGAPPMQATGDIAALRIETGNGSFTIEQRIRVRRYCTAALYSRGGGRSCSARIDILRAPKGELDKLADRVDSNNLVNAHHEDQWLQALLASQSRIPPRESLEMLYQRQPFSRRETALPLCENRSLPLLHMQDDLNRKVDAPGNSSRDAFGDTHRFSMVSLANVFDWADFVLDFDRLPHDPDACRGTSAVRRWSSDSGQSFRTANPEANPNGVLPGVWTQAAPAPSSNPQ